MGERSGCLKIGFEGASRSWEVGEWRCDYGDSSQMNPSSHILHQAERESTSLSSSFSSLPFPSLLFSAVDHALLIGVNAGDWRAWDLIGLDKEEGVR